jgi:hypothetical protein
MDEALRQVFTTLFRSVVAFAPQVSSVLVLVAVGWLCAWVVKRLVIRVCVVLRIERVFRQTRWGAALSKADVRYALFSAIGNVAFVIVFLAFANAALVALNLKQLSALLAQGASFIPRAIIALTIIALGSVVAGRVALAIQSGLKKEDVPRATLAGRFSRAVLLLFFSAMALVEIEVAPTVVLIGFTVAMVTLAVIAILVVWSTTRHPADTPIFRADAPRRDEDDEARDADGSVD